MRAATAVRFVVLASVMPAVVRPLLSADALTRYQFSADAMGGTFSIALYSARQEQANAASSAAFAEARRLDRMLSHYREDSEWSGVNRHAAERPVTVPGELFDLVAEALAYSRLTDGAFDITVGALMNAWGFRDGGKVPSDEAVRRALSATGPSNVVLDTEHHTIRFARPGVELDPGGIAKGYAVDRMVAILRAHGIERALVSAAGSSLYALGAPPGEDGWPIVIRRAAPGAFSEHVQRPAGPAGSGGEVRVFLRNEALSISGRSGKSFRSQGRVYGHVMDPRTGFPAAAALAAVIAPRAIDCEAWTKAVLINTREWSAQHTPRGWRVFVCGDERATSCAWLR